MESTVITHLSNVINIIPPTPVLPDHVYFENGYFNTNLVPSGFNFNNNVAIYDYDDDWSRLIWDGDYHDDAVNGTIARLKVNSSVPQTEKWVLTNNSLQFVHTQGEYEDGYRGEVLFLPVSGWRPAYNYTCIEYNLTTDDGEELDWILYIIPYAYDDWLLEEGQYCYDDCPGENITLPTASSILSIHSVNEDVVPVESIDLIEIACNFMRSNDIGFTINITKIYGSNMLPNEN